MSYLQLAAGFARAGLLGYGGGPSVIPLIRFEAVERYQWLEDDDFAEILALANALPGPIATKLAAYVGYKVKGSAGAAVAVLSHILPTVLAMISLYGVLFKLRNSPTVSGMVQGVTPVIGVMLAVMAYEFFDKAKKGFGFPAAVFLTLTGGAAFLLGVHPAVIIAVFLGGSYMYATYRGKVKKA